MANFFLLMGFFTFTFSILYLIIHFVKKIKNKERVLSKKLFYPTLFGGLLLLSIASVFIDTTDQGKLNATLEDNEKLSSKNESLEKENNNLQKEIDELESKLENTTDKITEYEEEIASFKEEKTDFNSEKESLKEKISNLEEKNSTLQNKVDKLNTELTETKTSTSKSNNSASQNTDSGTNSSSRSSNSSNSNVYYKNCDAARQAGATPVRRGDPGYGSHLDRDGDGVACE